MAEIGKKRLFSSKNASFGLLAKRAFERQHVYVTCGTEGYAVPRTVKN